MTHNKYWYGKKSHCCQAARLLCLLDPRVYRTLFAFPFIVYKRKQNATREINFMSCVRCSIINFIVIGLIKKKLSLFRRHWNGRPYVQIMVQRTFISNTLHALVDETSLYANVRKQNNFPCTCKCDCIFVYSFHSLALVSYFGRACVFLFFLLAWTWQFNIPFRMSHLRNKQASERVITNKQTQNVIKLRAK